MKNHKVKCWVRMFERVKDGIKTFDVRNNDRDYQAGDTITLKEWDNEKKIDPNNKAQDARKEDDRYTGQELTFLIGYVMPLSQVPLMSYAVLEAIHRDKGANLVILSLLPLPASM